MSPTFGSIKSSALSSLKGHWCEAIAASMALVSVSLLNSFLQAILMGIFKVDAIWTFYSPTVLPQYNTIASVLISVFSSLFSLMIVFPLFFGVLRWFWMVAGGEKAPLDAIFYYFSSGRQFARALAVAFAVLWRIALGAVLCFLPLIIANIISSPAMYSAFGLAMPIWLSGVYPLKVVVRLFCICFFALWILRYSLFYAAALAAPGIPVRSMFARSVAMTKGRPLRFLAFSLSFIGWYFLCILVLPLIFVLPYLLASFSVYGHAECSEHAAKPVL